MGIIAKARARWRRFMGRAQEDLLFQDAQQAAQDAEEEYRQALRGMQRRRARFDTRPPSDPPPGVTLEDISDSLDEQEKRMREALDDGKA